MDSVQTKLPYDSYFWMEGVLERYLFKIRIMLLLTEERYLWALSMLRYQLKVWPDNVMIVDHDGYRNIIRE
jgi:hypothetical protein